MAFTLPEGLAPEMYPLAWLVGRWRGEGVVGYPGIEETAFTQDVVIEHDGGPYLSYTSTLRLVVVPDDASALAGADASTSDASGTLVDSGTPVDSGAEADSGAVWSTERGFWRIPPDRPEGMGSELFPVELLLADPSGHVAVYVGATGNGRIDLVSDVIARTATGAEVTAGKRLYGLVQGDLMWAHDLAAFGESMQSYASARLSRAMPAPAPRNTRGRADAESAVTPIDTAAAAPEPPRHRSPLLSRHGAVAGSGPDAGVAWHYGDPTAEQRALTRGGAVVDQSHLGIVRVTGPDRLSWLHSITSQQLTDLPPRTSTELLVLSPQGHVEHAAGVVDDGEATWLITETAPALAVWLDRMRFMLRVEVADVTDDWAAIGEPVDAEGTPDEPVTWRDPWPRTAPGGTRYGVDDAEHPGIDRAWRLVLVPRAGLVDAVAAREAAGRPLVGTWAGEAVRVEAWRPRFGREVDHRTIPHELDWLRTAVHLDKGCYRGQETVARVHNLGRPPRRLVMLHLDGSGHLLPEAGAVVRDLGDLLTTGEPGREIGRVTSLVRHHEIGPVALAVVKRSVPSDVEVVVDCDGGPITAAQEVVVPGDGVSVDRPDPHGPLTRGLGGHPML